MIPLLANAQEFSYKQFGKDQGLISSTVFGILEDEMGYLWFATDKGVVRFDGNSYKNYYSPMVKNKTIIKVFDVNERIWFLNLADKLFFIENDSIYSFAPNEFPADVAVKYMIEGNNGNIWISTHNNGLYRFQAQEDGSLAYKSNHYFTEPMLVDYMQMSDANRLYVSGWGTTEGNIYTYNSSSDSFEKVAYDVKFYGAITSDYKKIYFSRNNDIFLLSTGEGDHEEIKLKGLSKQIEKHRFVYHDSNGRFWVLTSELGVQCFDQEKKITNFIPEEISKTKINDILEDREGNIWLTSSNGGVFVVYNRDILNYTSQNSSIPNNLIREVLATSEKGVVFTSIKGNVNFIDSLGKLQHQNVGEINRVFYDIAETSSHLYFAGMGMVVVKSPITNLFKGEYEIKNLWDPKFEFKSFAIDKADNMYLGTREGVKKAINDTEYKSISELRNYAILAASDQKVWLGSIEGLFLYNREDSISSLYTSKNNLSIEGDVQAIEEDADGSIFVATNGYGLFKIADDVIEKIGRKEGIGSLFCNDLHIDSERNIWLATISGLYKLSFPTYKPTLFNKKDGLLTDEIYSVTSIDNTIWLGTPKGLTRFGELKGKSLEIQPIIHLREVVVNNGEHLLKDGDELDYYQNNIQFNYQGILHNNSMSYKYKLKGLDDNWQSTNENQAVFSGLSPGKYTFQVKGWCNFGESIETASVSFRINALWYKTTAFLIGALLAGLGLLFLFFTIRIDRVRKEEQQKNKIAGKMARLELKALQAQMNPHFVFNALNSIQNFIGHGDEYSTNKYLTKFSSLMRGFLESTNSNYLTLSEEIDLIKLYIELEHLRFKDKFDYEINIPNEIDITSIEIPSMLLQPFVENAINHGLKYLTQKGFLEISVNQEENSLIINIIDNGVGRKKAQTLKHNMQNSYKSRGMTLVKDRVELLNTIDDFGLNVLIIDLYDNDGKAKGTKVKIEIQLD